MKSYIEKVRKLRRDISHKRLLLQMPLDHDAGQFGPKYKGVYLHPGGVLNRQQSKLTKTISEDKSPKARFKHVGVELEFCSKGDRNAVLNALYDAGLSSSVTLKSDGSLRVSEIGDYTHEVTILAPENKYAEIVYQTCAALKRVGGYVNKTCGMHAHIDCRSRDASLVYDRLLKSLGILYAVVPYERRFNKYCKRNDQDSTFDTMVEASDDRYYAINARSYTKHNTIEVRLHSGTINPLKVCNWVKLLLTIVNTKNEEEQYDLEAFITKFKVDLDLAIYLRDRAAKFNRGHALDEEHVTKIWQNEDTESLSKCMCSTCNNARQLLKGANRLDYAQESA